MAEKMSTDAIRSNREIPNVELYAEEVRQQLNAIKIEDNFNLSLLTQDDIRKITFLLSPYLSDADRTMAVDSDASLVDKIKRLIFIVNRSLRLGKRTMDTQRLVYELLYLIKRYRLLKLQPGLEMCSHKAIKEFRPSSDNVVPDFWRKMFEICENLDDAETDFLRRNYCDGDTSLKHAEDVVLYLKKNGNLATSDLSIFNSAFDALQRNDLKKLVQDMQCYNMEVLPGQKQGLAVIINQRTFTKPMPRGAQAHRVVLPERKGTDVDAGFLKAMWESFGLEVQLYVDLSSEEIHGLVESFAKKPFDLNVFVCCVLSHGEQGYFYGSDRVSVLLDDVLALFGESENFEGIPKLFFVQACQGDYEQQGIGGATHPVRRMCHDGPGTDLGKAPLYSDMLIGRSTIPGYVSYRSEENGSVYIRHLVETLSALCETEHLADMMTTVNNRVARERIDYQYKQTTTFGSQLRYKLYFKKSP